MTKQARGVLGVFLLAAALLATSLPAGGRAEAQQPSTVSLPSVELPTDAPPHWAGGLRRPLRARLAQQRAVQAQAASGQVQPVANAAANIAATALTAPAIAPPAGPVQFGSAGQPGFGSQVAVSAPPRSPGERTSLAGPPISKSATSFVAPPPAAILAPNMMTAAAGQAVYLQQAQAPAGQIRLVSDNSTPAQPAAEHPLASAVRFAKQSLERMRSVKDYTATLAKRERVDGVLGEYQYLNVKVRNDPFSVYLGFVGPANMKGQEAIYITGQNDGKLWAHPTGIKQKIVGTLSLKPDSMLAMSGNRYPITELGIKRLLSRLAEVGEQDMRYGECTVDWIKGAKVNDRICTCIQVVHPVPRSNFIFHKARIYVDDELQVPIRYEAYDWPAAPGGEPVLLEEYTYLKLRLNPGLTDADFDIKNPNYQFN